MRLDRQFAFFLSLASTSSPAGECSVSDNSIPVQVKSAAQVGSPVVNELQGVMATHGGDQGLLIAWEGLPKQAQDTLKNNKLRVRVWQAADVVDAVLSNCEGVPSEIRTARPLKRVWILQDA